MSTITLDFETYYSKDYSLSKMTTEAYIRDPRFQVIGFAYRIEHEAPVWVTGSDQYIEDVLRGLMLENHKLVAHNAAFDAGILSFRYNIHPKWIIDTLGMARPITGHTVGGSLSALAKLFCLGEKGTEVVDALGLRREDFSPEQLASYGEYCINDVVITQNLYYILTKHSTVQEMYIIDLMMRMYTDPLVHLNQSLLKTHLVNVRERKERLMDKIDAAIGRDELMSNPKFAQILEKFGVAPPMKVSSATGKETYAFSKVDQRFKDLLDHPDERVQAVVAARLGVKSTLEETRTESFIGVSERGTLPIMLNYYGANATGRASGGEKLNLQNLPRGGVLRQAMQPPEGHTMIACDSSQIEARMIAWLAGETALVQAFLDGKDIYSLFASTVYGRTIKKGVDNTERHVGKTAILGLGYGMGKDRFRDSLKTGYPSVTIDIVESERIVNTYRGTYPKIVALWKQGDQALLAMATGTEFDLGIGIRLRCNADGVHLPNGMKLKYNGIKKTADGFEYTTRVGRSNVQKKIYGAMLIENICQALARIVVFTQMAIIDQKLRKVDNRNGARFKVILTVHDEVVAVAPQKAGKKVEEMMVKVMSTAPKWAEGLPVACEAGIGDNYGECK